jgi:chemotaxis family two-component system sensor kinase Cph1
VPDPVEVAAALTACAAEPIHRPGAVQPYGSLLVTTPDGFIRAASENTVGLLGVGHVELLGRQLRMVFGDPVAYAMLNPSTVGSVPVNGLAGHVEAVSHRSGDYVLIELEGTVRTGEDVARRLLGALRAFHGATDVKTLLSQAARTVRDLTGFDRVMIYQFDDSWNGEVVAEAIATADLSFLGLRFPASDIPAQARAMYDRDPIRVIPDVAAPPSPLRTVDGLSADAVDLSGVSVRAVSPVHLQYLRNMGVRSSMSVALHLDGRLWGLVTCHNLGAPLLLPRELREGVELVGRTTSTLLYALGARESSAVQLRLLARLDELTAPMWHDDANDPAAILIETGPAYADLLDATAAAVVTGRRVEIVGAAPPSDMVRRLVAHARDSGDETLRLRELSVLDPAWGRYVDVAAGALLARVDTTGDRWLVWFRPETRTVVRWGGDPTAKEAAVAADGAQRLTPRASFAEYLEDVSGVSTRWTGEELHAATTLARRMSDADAARARRASALSATIQRTIMLDAFPPVVGVDGAARYRPCSNEPIGGDWYDVLFRSGGQVVVALGDVAGHGIEAAATMSQLRHALRAYVVAEDDIAAAMSRLNDLMLLLLPNEIASAMIVRLDIDAHQVHIVNAGHLPPMAVGPQGARYVNVGHDVVLGARRGTRYHTTTVDLPPDSMLVLFTDGLAERRTETIDQGLDQLLLAICAAAPQTPAEICEHLLSVAAAHADHDDDTTIVAFRFTNDDASQ